MSDSPPPLPPIGAKVRIHSLNEDDEPELNGKCGKVEGHNLMISTGKNVLVRIDPHQGVGQRWLDTVNISIDVSSG